MVWPSLWSKCGLTFARHWSLSLSAEQQLSPGITWGEILHSSRWEWVGDAEVVGERQRSHLKVLAECSCVQTKQLWAFKIESCFPSYETDWESNLKIQTINASESCCSFKTLRCLPADKTHTLNDDDYLTWKLNSITRSRIRYSRCLDARRCSYFTALSALCDGKHVLAILAEDTCLPAS